MAYSPPPGGYAPPPGQAPGGPYGGPPVSQGMLVGALVANIFGLFLCVLLSAVGIVLAGVGLAKRQESPETARTMGIVAWVLFGVGAVIGLGIILWWIMTAMTMAQNCQGWDAFLYDYCY